MKVAIRNILDRVFTAMTVLAVIFISLVLIIVLGPMIWRGASAVVFRGTIEFRKMQLNLFGRGDTARIEAEMNQASAVRSVIYETIDKFKRGIDTESLCERARKIHREFGEELRHKDISSEEYTKLRAITKDIRDRLEIAFASQDIEEIRENIAYVLKFKDDARFDKTIAEEFFRLAADFQKTAETIDLHKFHQYAQSLEQVEKVLSQLLGHSPGSALPALVMERYGATRWEKAQTLLDELLWVETWIEREPGKPLVKIRTKRAEQFAGTQLQPLFEYIEKNLHKMLKPKLTCYWQFFIDDNIDGHYFGGVGPELLGTLLITVLGMLFAIPLGLVSAAYLVECSSDGLIVRIIRMGVNTLAGVPSIVFGLFGLAFFVLFLFPLLGRESKACILAASMTLAILTLPVMIRASEEAIRAVPQTYKEASLALGASRFRTFVTVTLPAALPGILTGVILSLSRIAGETAPVLFTGAVALGPLPKSVFDPTRTLSYGSYDMAVGDRVAMMVPHNQYGMVVTLIVLILCLNAFAIILRSRIFKKLQGH
jgi:phosphate transport system permease protein